MSEKKIIDELAKLAADPTQPPVVVTFVPPAALADQVDVYEKQLRELDARWKRTLEFGLRGLLTVDAVEAVKEQHQAEAEDVRRRLLVLRQPVAQDSYVFEAADALAGVIELLRQRKLPAEVLRAGLRDMGLVRVLADSPGLKIEWVA